MSQNCIYIEFKLYDWMIEERNLDHCFTTNDIVCKELSFNPYFKDLDPLKLQFWVYDFMKSRKLVVRSLARVS